MMRLGLWGVVGFNAGWSDDASGFVSALKEWDLHVGRAQDAVWVEGIVASGKLKN